MLGGLTLSEVPLGQGPGGYDFTIYASMDVLLKATYKRSNTVDAHLRATYVRAILTDAALSARPKRWYTTDVILLGPDRNDIFGSQVIQNATSGPLF